MSAAEKLERLEKLLRRRNLLRLQYAKVRRLSEKAADSAHRIATKLRASELDLAFECNGTEWAPAPLSDLQVRGILNRVEDKVNGETK